MLLAARHDVSCIRPGAASRVAVWELLPWSSCVRQLEGLGDGRPAVAQWWLWRRLIALDSHNAEDGVVVPGMVASLRGWPYRDDGDGGDVPHWFDVTASSREGARQVPVPFSRVLPSSFEGAVRGPYESGRHSVIELTSALPHSVIQWRGWPHREVGETAPGYDSQAVSEGRHGVDSSLTQAPALFLNIKYPGRGSGCESSEPARPSSEAESHRGGVQPSSEPESHPRGRPALE
jgi:hypothetical protein